MTVYTIRDENGNKIDLLDKKGVIIKKYTHKRNCPVCENGLYNLVFSKAGFDHVKCSSCGMFYVPRVVNENILQKFYDQCFEDSWDERFKSEEYAKFKKQYFKKMVNLIARYKKKGMVLDIGCGAGIFLSILKKRGWIVEGTDFNGKVRKFVKEKYNIPVYDKQITDFKTETYNVVAASYVLEHIIKPKEFVIQAHNILKKEGLLVLSIPNEYAISAKIMGKYSDRVKAIEHINFFSEETISRFLKDNGFELLYISTKQANLHGVLNFFIKTKERNPNLTKTYSKKSKFSSQKISKNILSFVFYKIFTPLVSKFFELFGMGEDLIVIAKKR